MIALGNGFQYSSRGFSRVWTSGQTGATPLLETVDASLVGQKSIKCYQASWMGRGCIKPVADGYLSLKGIGPSPGSEEFRLLMEDLWTNQSPIGRGGCMRLHGRDFPLLVPYIYEEPFKLKIFDPRPEGYSVFGAVAREALFSDHLAGCGALVPQPLAVYRRTLQPDWRVATVEAESEYLIDRFNQLAEPTPAADIRVENLYYSDMDVGVLARKVKHPNRLQEIVQASYDGQPHLEKMDAALSVEAGKRGFSSWVKEMERGIARNLGAFLRHGIIHGQLETHYQNLTMAGEICDWDAGVIGDRFATAAALRKTIITADRTYGTVMAEFLEKDQERFSDYGEQSVRQIYAMSNANAFAHKLNAMARGHPFTEDDRLAGDKRFAKLTVEALAPPARGPIAEMLEQMRDVPLRYDLAGYSSILGWARHERPHNHFKHICDARDERFVEEDVRRMIAVLKKEMA